MRLYHGSTLKIERIDLGCSRNGKDFGRGFYLSDNYLQAKNFAEQKAVRYGGEAVVTEFEFDEQSLHDSQYSVKLFTDYSEEWVQFVAMNRFSRAANRHGYDMVYGPIANDQVGLQLTRYRRGYIDLGRLLEELKFRRMTFQYFFGTGKAIKLLQSL